MRFQREVTRPGGEQRRLYAIGPESLPAEEGM
jgi:hypothetical protein